MSKLKVLAFNGSPRLGGNTAAMLAALEEGVVGAGGEMVTIRVCDLDIQPCTACGACDETGECIIEDDMAALYPRIMAADRLVLASPIYFYGLTAQTKALVDRSQALWNRGRLGLERGPQAPQRRGLLLAVAATKGPRVFEGAILTAKYAFDAMGFAHGGELLVRGLDAPGDAVQQPESLQRATKFGYALVQE
ncbi:flavodoxin family protein [Desulfurivibrio alkaliphilus]|uniref:NADPH-dependent FMN reductase n=1 Tax=Desulfurivibrio alkaliphilus (strain DSM 19089 / UNIQEM U267 / AHT2) TaxID=589865 RepID=D6Z2I7_DESAT|nr:flavodoxin family protein [Desulfurivibrio alkaliphilus]ADH85762.1 NADPH-dependent FMN reductase [Desulfurivibrio alkaliphilus AHT 2]